MPTDRIEKIAGLLNSLDDLISTGTIDELRWIHRSILASTRIALEERGVDPYIWGTPVEEAFRQSDASMVAALDAAEERLRTV